MLKHHVLDSGQADMQTRYRLAWLVATWFAVCCCMTQNSSPHFQEPAMEKFKKGHNESGTVHKLGE